MIRFLYEEDLIELSGEPVDLTVLDWLRIHRQRTGTKEGCGSGDCGACTVVIASPAVSDALLPSLKYESINSCITFIGALHGKHCSESNHWPMARICTAYNRLWWMSMVRSVGFARLDLSCRCIPCISAMKMRKL